MIIAKPGGSNAGDWPKRTLLLSLVSLLVPLLSSSVFPEWTSDDIGMLVWVLALVPAFLLSYQRGWRGSSLALAGAMAAFSLGQVILLIKGSAPPPPEAIFGAVVILLSVALGSGWLSTAFRATLDETERLALTDPGTTLPNRRHANLHLDRAFEAARRGIPLTVVAFDLDHFKGINDRFGHATGDRILVDFAGILKARTRRSTLSARIGGEEFIAILDGVAAEGAQVFANLILDDMRAREYSWGRVTASAGIAEYEAGMTSPDVLMAAADQALYRAKQSGRDRVSVMARMGRRTSAMPVVAAPPAAAARAGGSERILVVDDEPAVLRVLAKMLERLGYTVLQAVEPDEALAAIGGSEGAVDLLLTDVVMPSMSGFRLVQVIEEQHAPVRVLYMSGYDDSDVDWAGVPGLVRGFLQKPIEQEALAAAVRQALDATVADAGQVVHHGADRPLAGERGAVALLGAGARADELETMLTDAGFAEVIRSGSTGMDTLRSLARGTGYGIAVIEADGSEPGLDAEVVRVAQPRSGDALTPVLLLVGGRAPEALLQTGTLPAVELCAAGAPGDMLVPLLRKQLALHTLVMDHLRETDALRAQLTAYVDGQSANGKGIDAAH